MIVTNAGTSVSPAERKRREAKEKNTAVIQDAIRRAMQQTGGQDLEVQSESIDSPMVISSRWHHADGFIGPKDYQIRELMYLEPLALVECAWWPDGTGVRKELNAPQWQAILSGAFCFRCRHRRIVPLVPCKACGWTDAQTQRAVEVLYRMRFLQWAPSRAAGGLVA